MKKLLFISLLIFCQTAIAQYSMTAEIKNFKQINETTIQWEVWIASSGASSFAYYGGQFTFQFNNNILNGGKFDTDFFTITGGENMTQHAGFYNNADAVITGTPPNQYFNWTSSSPPNTGQAQTIITSTQVKFATFQAQLRNGDGDGLPHNFADMDIALAFHSTSSNIASRDQTTSATYSGSNTPITINGFTPAKGVSVNTRELAGYCFSGTGNWSETARWNNVTTANAHTLPSDTKNALIIGSANVNSNYTISQLIIAEDAYLEINSALSSVGYLTVNENEDIYNDNPADIGGVGTGATSTLAEWNFETNTNRTADIGTSTNVNLALISNGGELTITDGIVANKGFNNTKGLVGRNFYYWPAEPLYSWWQIHLNSSGFQNLILDVTLTSNNTLGYYKTQWSLNGTEWNDVINGLLEMPNTAGTYASPIWNSFSNIVLPVEIENNSSIYVRFLVFHPTNNEFELSGTSSRNMIDNIKVTGEELPPPPAGLLLESSAYGTGSLIHNTTGVNATVQRYLADLNNYHFISKPVTTSITFDDMFPAPDWSNMLVWVREFDEPTATWVNKHKTHIPAAGRGYATYITTAPTPPVAIFEGALGNGNVTRTLSNNGSGWNLVGNPYPSAVDCDLLTRVNIDDAVYAWGNGNYKSWIAGVGSLSGGTVPAGQGFFLHAKTGGGSVTFTNSSRVHDNTSFWKSGNNIPELLSVTVTNSSNPKSDQVFIRFNSEATVGFDSQFDAYKLHGDEDAPEIYTSGETIMSINTLNAISETPGIPLGFKAGVAGVFTFTAEGMESFINEEAIVLEDMNTGIRTNLRLNPVYSFTSEKGTFDGRFKVWFSSVGITENDQPLLDAYALGSTIHVIIPEGTKGTVNVYNVFGQLVATRATTNPGSINIELNSPAGAYIVQYESATLTLIRKLITH